MAAFRRSLGTLSVDTRSLDGINTDQHLFAVVPLCSGKRGEIEDPPPHTHTEMSPDTSCRSIHSPKMSFTHLFILNSAY